MIYEVFVVMGTLKVWLLCIACLEKLESVEKLVRMQDGVVYTFPFLHASPTLISLLCQRLHKSIVSAESGLSETLLGLG